MNGGIMSIFIVFIFLCSAFSGASSSDISEITEFKKYTCLDYIEEKAMSINFSDPKPISELDISCVSSKAILDSVCYRKSIDYEFYRSSCKFKKIDNIYSFLTIEDLDHTGLPGNPTIDLKTIQVTFPGHINVIDVNLFNAEYLKVDNPVLPAPKSEPLFWKEKMNGPMTHVVIPNSMTYASDELYPGKIFSYDVGYSTDETIVYLRIYPIQYKLRSCQAFFIFNGQIDILYSQDNNEKSELLEAKDWENIIISPPSLYDEALRLSNYHNLEGTRCTVIDTTWISYNYEEAENPPFPGFDNLSSPVLSIADDYLVTNYSFTLAKKIISFLDDYSYHPNLSFVTLLGNARLIPPSYYITAGLVPTDFFYASPDYDLVTNYKIGRLPVDNLGQANHVINKIMHWNATTELFNNITVAGGRPFGTEFDIGEMIVVDMINQGLLNGINPTKCFRTENSFRSKNLTHALMGDTGLVFHIGHGSGTAIGLDDGVLGVQDLLDLPYSDTNPIVISISCMNGAFDTNIANLGFNLSFGESLLLSDGGGIAYISGSRSNAGQPVFGLNNGYLSITDETYMARMLTDVMKSYSDENTTTLGDLTDYAYTEYVKHHDFEDTTDEYTFFCFTLLGDPALHIPERPVKEEYDIPITSIQTSDIMIDAEELYLSFYDDSVANNQISLNTIRTDIKFPFISSSTRVEIKIVDCFDVGSAFIEKATYDSLGPNGFHEFNSEKASLYCMRVISEDGKEGWLFFSASRMVDDSYLDITLGINSYRFKSLNDAINDSGENEIIYVWNGTYYEHLLLEKSYYLIGENCFDTIIDGMNQGTVFSMNQSDSLISGFTIRNAGSNGESAGFEIVDSSPIISNNIINNNGQFGVKIFGDLSTPLIDLNTIEGNIYGIFIDSEASIGLISRNKFDNNSIGLYVSRLNNSIILYNIINSRKMCVELFDCDNSIILGNEFRNANIGVFLNNSRGCLVGLNNFFDNEVSAGFNQIRNVIWLSNYWDHSRVFPKFIFGTLGRFFKVPWVNCDYVPAETPYQIYFIKMGLKAPGSIM